MSERKAELRMGQERSGELGSGRREGVAVAVILEVVAAMVMIMIIEEATDFDDA